MAVTTITDFTIKTRHIVTLRLLTYIGQNPEGRRMEAIYEEDYIWQGLFNSPEEARQPVRDMFISAKNVGLLSDVALKQGRGYTLAVTSGGRKYYPILENGLPEEVERRKKFGLKDVVEVYEKSMENFN